MNMNTKTKVLIGGIAFVLVFSFLFAMLSSMNREINDLWDRQDDLSDDLDKASSTTSESVSDTKPVVTPSKNLLNPATVEMGYAVDYENGEMVENAERKCTDYIVIEANENYFYSDNSTSYGGVCCAFYDENKVFISGSVSEQSFLAPENAVYLRLSVSKTRTNMMLEKGAVGTEFEEYRN